MISPKDFLQENPKIVAVAIIALVILLGGIWFASQLPNRAYETKAPSSGTQVQTPVFTDLRIGTLVRDSFATQKNPPIKQKPEYTVKEKLMLRGKTTSAVTAPLSVTVRLVDEQSRIIPLSPSTVTLDPGTSAYCCWTIPTPGKYTVQILRPDSITTNIPLKIVKDFETAPKSSFAPIQ